MGAGTNAAHVCASCRKRDGSSMRLCVIAQPSTRSDEPPKPIKYETVQIIPP